MLDKLRTLAHVSRRGQDHHDERILYYAGPNTSSGDVDDGDTTTDFDPLERAKGITSTRRRVESTGAKTRSTSSTPRATSTSPGSGTQFAVLDGAIGSSAPSAASRVQSGNRVVPVDK